MGWQTKTKPSRHLIEIEVRNNPTWRVASAIRLQMQLSRADGRAPAPSVFTRLLDYSILVFRRARLAIPSYTETCHIAFVRRVPKK